MAIYDKNRQGGVGANSFMGQTAQKTGSAVATPVANFGEGMNTGFPTPQKVQFDRNNSLQSGQDRMMNNLNTSVPAQTGQAPSIFSNPNHPLMKGLSRQPDPSAMMGNLSNILSAPRDAFMGTARGASAFGVNSFLRKPLNAIQGAMSEQKQNLAGGRLGISPQQMSAGRSEIATGDNFMAPFYARSYSPAPQGQGLGIGQQQIGIRGNAPTTMAPGQPLLQPMRQPQIIFSPAAMAPRTMDGSQPLSQPNDFGNMQDASSRMVNQLQKNGAQNGQSIDKTSQLLADIGGDPRIKPGETWRGNGANQQPGFGNLLDSVDSFIGKLSNKDSFGRLTDMSSGKSFQLGTQIAPKQVGNYEVSNDSWSPKERERFSRAPTDPTGKTRMVRSGRPEGGWSPDYKKSWSKQATSGVNDKMPTFTAPGFTGKAKQARIHSQQQQWLDQSKKDKQALTLEGMKQAGSTARNDADNTQSALNTKNSIDANKSLYETRLNNNKSNQQGDPAQKGAFTQKQKADALVDMEKRFSTFRTTEEGKNFRGDSTAYMKQYNKPLYKMLVENGVLQDDTDIASMFATPKK